MPKRTQASIEKSKQACKKSWERALTLAQLTAEGTETPPELAKLRNTARQYLAMNKGEYDDLFETGLDRRNPKVRDLLNDFNTYRKNPRPSKGNPKRPPRAGAPRKRPQKPRKSTKPRTHNPGNLPADILHDLRTIQRTHGVSINDLGYCIKVLGDIIDSPLDTTKLQ